MSTRVTRCTIGGRPVAESEPRTTRISLKSAREDARRAPRRTSGRKPASNGGAASLRSGPELPTWPFGRMPTPRHSLGLVIEKAPLRTGQTEARPIIATRVLAHAKYPVTSKRTPMVSPVLPAQYMKSSLPPLARGTVTPLARLSPVGKLMVEVAGWTPLVSDGAAVT